MLTTLGMGVIGVGSIGRHHARILSGLAGVELVAVADPRPGAAAQAGMKHVTQHLHYETLLADDRIEAVVLAAPTRLHGSIALHALGQGKHVLVEKPVAATLSEAAALISAADDAGVVLSVGHVERFNPAVQELQRRLAIGELGSLFQIHVQRTGPFPHHVVDVGVTIDLATHDLDVLSFLLQRTPETVFAQTARWVHHTHEDLLMAMLKYSGELVASLDINWLSPAKTRRIRVTGERGMFIVDYLTQDLTRFENGDAPGRWDTLDVLRGVSEGRSIRYPVARREPLALELEAFVGAIRQKGVNDIVTGADGLRALALALALLESADRGEPLPFSFDQPQSPMFRG